MHFLNSRYLEVNVYLQEARVIRQLYPPAIGSYLSLFIVKSLRVHWKISILGHF